MKLSRRNWIKTAAGLVLPAWAADGAVINISSPRYNSFGPVYDSEVVDWIARVVANGGSLSTSTKNAANTFMLAIKAVSGLRAKILRLNLFAGDQFLAAQVPLIKDYGGSVDIAYLAGNNPATSSDFTYVETGATGGLKALTAGAYLGTGLGMITPYSADSYTKCSLGAYVKTVANEAAIILGAQDTGGGSNSAFFLVIGYVDGNTYAYPFATGGPVNLIPDTPRKGFYLMSRTSSTLATLYRDGVSVASNSSSTIVTPGTDLSLDVFAYHTLVNTAAQPTTKQLLGHMEGRDLSGADTAALSSAWLTFNTTLTRQP